MVAPNNRILIGLHQKSGERYNPADINPVKYEADRKTLKEYVFDEADYVVVLSEGSRYSGIIGKKEADHHSAII